MKILIVEDDVNSRVFLERALLSQGYTVESAANGVQALEKATLSPPDLIISDILMPEMDGFELCRRVKTDERLHTIPFVFYTATYIEQKDEKLAMALGASRFLIKPMEPEKFFRTIKGIIEEHWVHKLSVPDHVLAEMTELDRMQVEALARKLDKKVRELEKERKELRRVHQDWENIFQAIGHPTIILDAQHNILSVNSATIKAAGAGSAEELIGRKCYEIFHKASEPPKGCPLVKMLASTKLEESEMEVEAFGGVFLVSCTPVFDEKGDLQKIIHIATDITERKKKEETLQRHLSIINTYSGMIALTDMEGLVIYMNAGGARMAGYEHSSEMIGIKRIRDFHPPKDLQHVMVVGIPFAIENGTWTGESRVLKADGSSIPVEQTIFVIRDENGQPHNLGTIMADITERKRAEDLLRMSEEKFRILFESIPLGTGVVTLEGTLLLYNEALAKITGYTEEELLTFNVRKLYQKPEDRDPLLKQLETNGFVRNYEVILKRNNGTSFYANLTINIIVFDGKNALLTVIEDITERKKVEESLHESEERYRTMFENSLDAVLLTIPDGRILSANPAACRMFGRTEEEICALGRAAVVDTSDPRLTKLLEERDRTGRASGELAFFRKDGSRFPGEISSLVFKGAAGNLRSSMIIRDITERKRAEEALRKEKIFSDTTINSLPGIFYLFDENGHFLRWNRNFEIISGYSSEETGKMNPLNFFSGEEKKLVGEAIQEVFVKGESNVEANFISKDGRKTPYYFKGLLFISDNRPYLIGLGIDITERKRAEEALRLSEAELHNAYFAQSAINIILGESLEDIPLELILQKALNMILAVPWLSFEPIGSIHIVENEPEVLVMKAWYNLPKQLNKLCAKVPFGTCLCGLAALTRKIQFADHIDERHGICYEGMASHGHYIVPLLLGSRTIGVIDIYLKEGHIRDEREEEFLRNVADTLAGIIVRKQGEDEKEKLNAQLLQAQKMEAVGQLAGGIAHDFNNILTAMIGYAHLLKMKLKEDDRLRTYADQILSLSDRAANLTQSLLSFSRKRIMNSEPVNLNEIIKTIDHLLSRIIGEDIRLQTVLSEEDPVVMADSGQIEQALMNLATNARDSMPEGGFLTIGTEAIAIDEEFIKEHGFGQKGEYALIAVTDTGTGMDRETSEKIFEPFFTTKEVGKGTGLGLSMVYGIIKQHEGYINVYSEPGSGTTFRIYLPLIKAKVEEIKPEVIQTVERGTETVLLAEDETEVKEFTKKMLEEYGYKVITAGSGQEAINEFKAHKDKIQLLLFDVIMPNKNGREAYEEIKKIRPDIRALFMSGYPADIINKHGILEKGFAYIEKPASPTKLLKKIKEVLGK